MLTKETRMMKQSMDLRSFSKKRKSSAYYADTSIPRQMARLRNGLACTGYIGRDLIHSMSLLNGITIGRTEVLI